MSHRIISDEVLEEKLKEFQNAIKSSKNLPEDIDECLMRRLLIFFNGDVNKALKRLTTNIDLRKSYPNIYGDRDPLAPHLRRLIDQVEMALLPQVTVDNNRILVIRLIDYNPENLIFEHALTVFSMVYDTTIMTPEPDRLADGEIVIFDVKGLSARHLTRMSLSSLRCFIKYMIDAHPLRLKQVHVVNTHSLLDKLLMIVRPFLGSKAMKSIHFHLPETTTLYDYVPRELLPKELGGTAGLIETPKWFWIKRTEDHRNYLLDNHRWEMKTKVEKENHHDESLNYLAFC